MRGFVTITNNADGSVLEYSLADYQRMRSLGANVQVIRIGMGSIGFGRGGSANPTYMSQLTSMVANAKQVGMYTAFKLTTYDVRQFSGASGAETWAGFWRDAGQSQAGLLHAWGNVWQAFKNEPAVLGYDLLNEPQIGSLGADDTTFVTKYLNPFYQKAIDQLRTIDSSHVAFFQPPFDSRTDDYLAYPARIARPNAAYAPHFYPNYRNYQASQDFSVTGYDTMLNRYLSEGAANGVPIFLGEYAMPWNPANDGNAGLIAKFQVLEKAATNRFIQNGLSFSRPWYCDDRGGATIGRFVLDHALVEGRNGLNGPLRTFITDIFTAAVTKNQTVA